MEQTKYTQIPPEGMFIVNVGRTVKHDSCAKMHYEFTYTVELRASENDFINLFAALVARHGKAMAKTYAAMMEVDESRFVDALHVLTGVGIREWGEAFAGAVARTLLRETDWTVGRIAREAGFGSVCVFSRWFRSKYGCPPGEWR